MSTFFIISIPNERFHCFLSRNTYLLQFYSTSKAYSPHRSGCPTHLAIKMQNTRKKTSHPTVRIQRYLVLRLQRLGAPTNGSKAVEGVSFTKLLWSCEFLAFRFIVKFNIKFCFKCPELIYTLDDAKKQSVK